MNQNDLKRDKYLQKKYGVTLDWYNQKLTEQGGGCAICGSKPITRSLPVDHVHDAKKKLKISYEVYKAKPNWWNVAWSLGCMDYLSTNFKSRSEAVKAVKDFIKARSARGVICFGCNTGIRKFRDKPELLEAAAAYLRKYKEQLG